MKKARYPSFRDFRPSSPSSSKAKCANHARATKAEVCLQRALRKLGLRFRTNSRLVLGIPDVVLVDTRIAIFCDGDFWHGRRWPKLRQALRRRANAAYWLAKIAANRRRDQSVTRSLRKAGWCVMRFWETDVHADVTKIAAKIAAKAGQLLN
jgi:DNA mismatch endonuclease (patch repair protein)